MKRVICSVLCCVAVLSIVALFMLGKQSTTLEANLLLVADRAALLQHNEALNTNNLTNTDIELLEEYRNTLLELNSAYLNLTEYLGQEHGIPDDFGFAPDPEMDNLSPSTEVEAIVPPAPTIENTDGLFQLESGDYCIPVNSMTVLADGMRMVRFEGARYVFPVYTLPVTYKIMQNSPKYVYTLDRYEWAKDKSYLAVRYISVYDGSQMIVRVYTDGKQATKIEVR